ncbi:hypothetical protein AAE478_003739 [Parahypoxylon ruwenzoriense]
MTLPSARNIKALRSPTRAILPKDIELPADAEDTISSVSWSPAADHLAAASWDGRVRVYDISASGAAHRAAVFAVEGPLLDCDWAKTAESSPVSQDGTLVAAGGADKKTHILHLATGQQASFSGHGAPIRAVRFIEAPASSAPIIASGSWDRTVKLWDLRQRTPVASIICQERVYAMDSKAQFLVVGTAGRQIHLVDLQNPTAILRTTVSPLEHQTKAVSVSPDGTAWVTAGIGGRCGINALEEEKSLMRRSLTPGSPSSSATNFTFKCHRDSPDAQKMAQVWSVNDVQFHPVHHTTFTTAGSDGSFYFWDLVTHQRLRGYPRITGDGSNNDSKDGGSAITNTAFSRDGTFFAYAVGYDWSRGCIRNTPQIRNRLILHLVSKDDAAPKRKPINEAK